MENSLDNDQGLRVVTKWLIALSCICTISQGEIFAQLPHFNVVHTIDYELNYRSDTNSKVFKQAYFVLQAGTKQSRFYDKKLQIQDSIVKAVLMDFGNTESASKAIAQKPAPHFKYIIDKNLLSGEVTFWESFLLNGVIHYKDTFNTTLWQIIGDTGRFGSFKTIKASCTFRGRKYSAWFVPEIPIQDGPYKFCGLPGLIVEVMDENNDYHFKMLSMAETSNQNLPLFHMYSQSKEVSRQRFLQQKSIFESNPLLGFTDLPNWVTVSEESKRAMMNIASERKKKNNNPIELN